ncbi:MAG: V-type ATP synthase subunit I [Chlamydiia bacterium]|nr:V-type ATP synthase subunit I [Chlamydiia bacterium]
MRVDVKKFLFAAVSDEKETFFKGAQKLGVIEFIDVEGKGKLDTPKEISDITQAIKVLRGQEPMTQIELDSIGDADRITNEVLELKAKHAKEEEKLRVLSLDLQRVQPFGDFSFEELKEIEKEGKRQAQFFCSKRGIKENLPDYPGLIYVASDEDLDYFFSLSEKPVQYDQMIEIKIDKTSGELKQEIEEASRRERKLEAVLKGYAKYYQFLHEGLKYHLNRYHLTHAAGLAQLPEEGLFVVEGWVPENKIEEVAAYANDNGVFMDEVATEANDRIPTYLENEGWGKVGEDLVGIYDTPSDTDKDPSLWVLLCFGIFFAFIVADGGYGLVYLLACAYFWWKFPKVEGLKRRILSLATFLSACCVIWGLLISSFFGVTLGIDNPIRKYSPLTFMVEKKAQWVMQNDPKTFKEWSQKFPEIKNAADGEALIREGKALLSSLADGALLELALFFGVIHIILGMIRYLKYNKAFLGWILFLIGSYLYFPYYLGVPSLLNYGFGIPLKEGGELGLQLIYIGITLAIVIAVIRDKLLGLTEGMNLIQIFSDVLSYLRLYALGLAGGIVGGVVNDAAAGLPMLFAILLALIGHGVNMALGIMGGVIHGLRLNFLEWYHYSFEGGGKKFKALDKLETNLD